MWRSAQFTTAQLPATNMMRHRTRQKKGALGDAGEKSLLKVQICKRRASTPLQTDLMLFACLKQE